MKKKFTHEEIARLAYELWQRRGHPFGSPEVDWHAAERALGVGDSQEQFSPLSVHTEAQEGAYREP